MRKFQFDAWAIFIAVVLIVAVLWGLLLHFQRRGEIRNLDPFALIPSDAWLVVDLKDTKDVTGLFPSDSLHWEELSSLEEAALFRQRIQLLDSIAEETPEFLNAIKKARVLVSLHTSLRGESPVLLQVRFNPDISLRQAQRVIEDLLGRASGQRDSDFLGNRVFRIEPAEGKPLYAAFFKGSLLLSPGRRLIEHAITQNLSGSALQTSADLAEIREVAGKRANNVFFNGHRLCEVLEMLLRMDSPSLMPCRAFSGWMGWDVAVIGDEIRLTGFARSGDEPRDFLGGFSGQPPSDPFLMNYIPSASAAFAIANFGSAEALNDSLRAYHSGVGEQEEVDSARLASVMPFSGQSLASVLLYAPGMAYGEGSLSLIQVSNPAGLWERMNNPEAWGEQQASLIPMDTVFDRVIWRFNPPGLVGALTLGMLPAEKPFVALQDSVLLAGASPQAVKQALMQIHYGQVIGKEPRLAEDFIFQQPASNLLYMVNVPYLSEMMKPAWQEGVTRLLSQIGEGGYPLDRLTAQFSAHRNGLFFSNVSLHSRGGGISRQHLPVWEVSLDTLAHTQPFSLRNHVDASKEIVVQDLSGNFYLIDRFGQVLWKKPVSGLMNSPVYQVDKFRNGRLQYLFSTATHLHLIDRNGKDVEGYPRRLPSGASMGITVVDYEGDRSYRIIYPGDDLRVHNLDLDGKRVSGWALPELEETAARPVQYLKLGSRDYLVAVDAEGRPYFFDRRGQVRLKVPGAFRLTTQNEIFTFESAEGNRFVALGKDGDVLQMDESGAVEASLPDTLRKGSRFLLVDPGGKKEPVFVFTHQRVLQAFDRLGTLVFSQALPGAVSSPLQVLRAGQEVFVALAADGQQQLYLFDDEGVLVPPFPLQGEKGFVLESLLQDQNWNIITVDQDRLLVYRLGGH